MADTDNDQEQFRSHGSVPVPDPTVLTTQLVDRALNAFKAVVDVRINAMDKATGLLSAGIEQYRIDTLEIRRRIETETDRHISADRDRLMAEIARVEAIINERFAAVDTRFLERDTRTEQAAQESRISLDAALAAAKEAVSEQNKANTEAIRKSELATQKQIDSLVALMTTANKSVEDKISDLKARLDRGEGQSRGEGDARTERRLDTGQVILAIGVVLAAIGIIVTLLLSRGV